MQKTSLYVEGVEISGDGRKKRKKNPDDQ